MSAACFDERLEQLGYWAAFHKHLIIELFTTLRDELGEEYWVDVESEIILVPRPAGPARSASPDVAVTQLSQSGSRRPAPGADVTPVILEADEPIGELEENWIVIRRRDWPDPDDRLGSRVVSIVELLSPSNKGVFGERDFRKFLSKRRDYLLSTVSHTEIDLLAGGTREFPHAVERLSEFPLIVWSSQVQETSRHYWAWGWRTDESLPTFVLPLDHPRICSVDLSACYERAYQSNHWPSRLSMVR